MKIFWKIRHMQAASSSNITKRTKDKMSEMDKTSKMIFSKKIMNQTRSDIKLKIYFIMRMWFTKICLFL